MNKITLAQLNKQIQSLEVRIKDLEYKSQSSQCCSHCYQQTYQPSYPPVQPYNPQPNYPPYIPWNQQMGQTGTNNPNFNKYY